MKFPIKKKFFDRIKTGKKRIEYRDAHITFVCEETGEILRMDVKEVFMGWKKLLPKEIQYPDLFEDDRIICFQLEDVQ